MSARLRTTAIVLAVVWLACAPARAGADDPLSKPLRIGVVGLVHDHIRMLFDRVRGRDDVQIVGVFESNRALVEAYFKDKKLDQKLAFPTLGAMLDSAKPDAVLVYTSTRDHRAVVEACAARGVHVMMEKPLAVSTADARAIARAAKAGHIHVLVNYETTWFPAHIAAEKIAKGDKNFGEIRKMVVHDGHKGPKEIGASPEFLAWLTDPVKNGGGALYDFGCYGANLATWLMNGARPLSVTAVTQQMKPDVYPKVDDDATVVLVYPRAVAILQGSWNWPFGRKDIEIYGQTGTVFASGRSDLRVRLPGQPETAVPPPDLEKPNGDPLDHLVAVVRGVVKPGPADLSGIENNVIVSEILDAARRSARTGRAVRLAR